MACALAGSLAPPRAPDEPPPWLDEAQADAFRLVLQILRSEGAALSAEPVGSGKTFLALAVARAFSTTPPVCLVPAALISQWHAIAERLSMPIHLWSHSRLSLGQLPPAAPSLVIVDESHHFRNPAIRRYRTLAPWLIGRRVLLLSATPVVNRSSDLYHQLHLGLRDDALSSHGAPSLRSAFDRNELPPAFGKFVVQRLNAAFAPSRRSRSEVQESGATGLFASLDALHLSTQPEVAALLRMVLYRSAASSAAALLAALRRYRHLLLHAQDALRAGRPVGRRHLRAMIGGSDEQLLIWPLLPAEIGEGDLRLEDLPALAELIGAAAALAEQPDAKAMRLNALLGDGVPSLVFVTARETIRYLRGCLSDRWVAWCTGSSAGIGGTSLPRRQVLELFRPGRQGTETSVPPATRTLLTTDVAAEGLNLQRAGRVVHYDLPWTDVRLAQRDGRAIRRGSHWSRVSVVQFLPCALVEDRLRQARALARKATLPGLVGLGPDGRHTWRWRREVATDLPVEGIGGVAAVSSLVDGVLAGVSLERDRERIVSALYWREAEGAWSDDPSAVEPRLSEALHATGLEAPSTAEVYHAISSLAPVVRGLLCLASAPDHTGAPPRLAPRRLGKRIRGLAIAAARRRDAGALAVLGPALQFCAGGHTAGEALLIETLLEMRDAELLAALATLPRPSCRRGPHVPHLTGLILFRRCAGAGSVGG